MGKSGELKLFTATVAEESLEKLGELGSHVRCGERRSAKAKERAFRGGTRAHIPSRSWRRISRIRIPNYAVTFNVPTTAEDVVIQTKKIAVVAAGGDKEYNFEPLTNETYAVVAEHYTAVEDLPEGTKYEEGPIAIPDVAGEFIYAEVESDPQVTPGSTTNFVKNWRVEGGDEDNYDIVTLNGTLTIKNREDRYKIELTVKSAEYTYDGQEHTVGLESATFYWGNGEFPGSVDAENNKVTFTVGEGTTYTVELSAS